MLKRILFVLISLLLVAQFFRPELVNPPFEPANDMLVRTNAPADIQALVKSTCYDCHSHHTNYPWYTAITPVNYWMKDHIEEGREHLNFSLWDRYATGKHTHEAGEEVAEGEMPPGYYTLVHGEARLSDGDRAKLVAWLNANLGSEGEREERGKH
ncbi:MAG: heme-binding domain-containing protein [Flavobacteriales bacterium]|nr:heme-binding domain-containing protein [Flavobacteriales bacterium]